jgi:hypothetical protein
VESSSIIDVNPNLMPHAIQAEILDENQVQETPPGFNLIQLPFADEIRDPPIIEAHRGTRPV